MEFFGWSYQAIEVLVSFERKVPRRIFCMEPLNNLKVATHERLFKSQHKIVEIEDQDSHLLKNNTKIESRTLQCAGHLQQFVHQYI